MNDFAKEVTDRIAANGRDADLAASAQAFTEASIKRQYSYNFSWLGRPIIQYPQDMIAMQELIWNIQPDLIIETGIAHGGSLIMSASLLELNAACGGNPNASVLGIDIDIRAHNRAAIDAHPMSRRIRMIQGSSIAPEVIEQARAEAAGKKRVLVCLDSNHTHDHVLAELKAYAPLATVGSYCVVFDTIVEDVPATMYPDRPWGPGNNPKSAVHEYLKSHDEFEIDKRIDRQLMISMAPDGYLKRVR
jgi:cephalosporin hydroxylase